MRCRLNYYPEIRRDFATADEVADVLNRSRAYVWTRLNGKKDFTYRERVMLATAVGRPETEANDYCRKEA